MVKKDLPPMLMVGNVIVHIDIITEPFNCDIYKCHGRCCQEGDAGAPVTMDEIADIEQDLDRLWPQLSAGAQAMIDKQGVAYPDPEGEMVTTIVAGRDCAFRGCTGCLLTNKPISCHLYPIREKRFGPDLVGINYHRWDICRDAIQRGRELNTPLYVFLREPLIRRFGKEWYTQLEDTVAEMKKQGLL